MGELKKFQNLFRDQFFEQSVAVRTAQLVCIIFASSQNRNQWPEQIKNTKMLYIAINNAAEYFSQLL